MDRMEAGCPACRSPHVILIAHDVPGPELAELEREGQEILAGCLVGENDPEWRCRACGYAWIKSVNAPP